MFERLRVYVSVEDRALFREPDLVMLVVGSEPISQTDSYSR